MPTPKLSTQLSLSICPLHTFVILIEMYLLVYEHIYGTDTWGVSYDFWIWFLEALLQVGYWIMKNRTYFLFVSMEGSWMGIESF